MVRGAGPDGLANSLRRGYRHGLARSIRGSIEPKDKEALAKMLRALAALFASANDGWEDDPSHPGYIQLSTPSGVIAVPFHLIGDFPSGECQQELLSLGKRLRVGHTSTLCLSGSTVFAGSLQYVGDLDFCEYIDGIESGDFENFFGIATEVRPDIICWGFRYPGGNPKRPWPTLFPTAPALQEAIRSSDPGRRVAKMDHLTQTVHFGTTEATNLILWVDKRFPGGGAEQASFAYQEAPLSVGWIPRSLADPAAASAYFAFLAGQIDHYGNPATRVKAAKRALAVALFMLFDEHAVRLRACLETRGLIQRDALAQREGLRVKVSAHADPAVRAFAEPLAATCVGLRACEVPDSKPTRDDYELACIINDLRDEVAEVLARA
jgi:hypothetical protein